MITTMGKPDEVLAPGTEVNAKYPFRKEDIKEGQDFSNVLFFDKHDVLTIIQVTKDPRWYEAKDRNGAIGKIPADFVVPRKEVKVHAMSWFHGKISREKAEELLRSQGDPEDGLFLVRESVNYPGDYTLCVAHQGTVQHYRIIAKQDRLTIDEEEKFENLIQLVDHYLQDADGLCTQLRQPLRKAGAVSVLVNVKDFADAGWVIRSDEIRLGKVLGKGEFGDVYQADFINQKVAVKTLKHAVNSSSSLMQSFLSEAAVMTALRHPNLVHLVGIVVGDPLYLVTEFMARGNLVDFLRTRGRNVITPEQQLNFAIDACEGMAYLESKGIVHRDLAARNVLIDESGVAKVSDFGLALKQCLHSIAGNTGGRAPASTGGSGGNKFPVKWTAPEALKNSVFTSASDVWSCGVMLWEIYSFGRVPYPRIPLTEVVSHVELGYRMEAPDACPDHIYRLMKMCWDLQPEKRPTFAAIVTMLKASQASPV